MSVAINSLNYSGLYEAELLVELMLRYWHHPFADDHDFRNALLETAVDALKAAVGGQRLLEDVPPYDMNFVAAVWYAEWNSVLDVGDSEAESQERRDWLERVRRSLPSCFCDPNRLDS